jgi:hypothetical protein
MKLNLPRSWFEQNISHQDQESGVGGAAAGIGPQSSVRAPEVLQVGESEVTYVVSQPARPLPSDDAAATLRDVPPPPA